MAETTILREFLVRLGYQIDEPSEKKTEENLNHVTLLLGRLAGTAVTATAALAATTIKMASQFEQVYWAAQRTGQSAVSIRSLGEAWERVGGKIEDAHAVQLKFASFLNRYGEGSKSVLQSLGIDPGETNEQSLKNVMSVLGERFKDPAKRMETLALADLFNFDEEEVFRMSQGVVQITNDIEKVYREAGTDLAQMDKDSMSLMNNLRDISTVISANIKNVWATLIAAGLPVTAGLRKDVLRMHGGGSVIPEDDKGVEWLWDNIAGPAIDRVLAMAGNAGAADRAGPPTPGGISDLVAGLAGDREAARRFELAHGGRDREQLPLGMRNRNPGNLMEPGGGEVLQTFDSNASGLDAMARQILRNFSLRSHDTIREIIEGNEKWPGYSRTDRPAYMAHLSRSLGLGLDAEMNLNNPQLLAGLMGSMIRMEQGYDPFKQDELLGVATARLGMDGAQSGGRALLQQTNTVTVYGATDPNATASAVGDAQERANSDLMLHFRPAAVVGGAND